MNEPRQRFDAFCGRCSRAYLTSQWPLPPTCDRCSVGLDDFHHDLPLGSVWVSA